MGNKMKKLLCAFIASAMLVTSMGAVSFAAPEDETAAETTVTETVADDASTADLTDEEKEADNADAEATEAPDAEATEAPAAEATEAPAVTTASGTSYDNDAYYQKALALCSSLGIISGYEDGSVRPESKVTRAEMASIVLRMLGMSATSTYKDIFSDVTSAHWAANTIQSAYEAKIVNGMGDGTFAPDSEVTYAQVIVMLVNAMNYKDDAEYYGGWQQGYIKEAGDLGLLKSAPGSADVASDRGVVIKMVYNALLADYKEVRTYDEYGNPKYEINSEHPSLAYAKFNVIDAKGVVYGTSKTSIGTKEVQDGQVDIKPEKETADNSVVYDTTLTGLEEYLAQKVTYYYIERSGLTNEVVAVTYDSSKSETYVIEDLDDIESVTGFENNQGKYKINRVSKAKDCSGATVIYNGKVVTTTALNNWLADNKDKTANDLYNPELGTIKLVNSSGSGDVYDFVFVDSYDTVIVSSASNDRLTGKVWKPTEDDDFATGVYTLKIEDQDDVTLTVTKGGSEARLRNLKKDDVANIKRSLDDTVVDVVVADDNITGTASGITKKVDASHATVNGQRYDVANLAVNDLKTGAQSTFYLDSFGRIANIVSSVAGLLQSGEKYGWLMTAYDAENKQDYIVQIMTTDGKAEEFKVAETIEFWDPLKTQADSKANAKTEITRLLSADANFVRLTNTNSKGVKSYSTPIRLVKYKTNSSGNVTRLYFAVDYSAVSDTTALRVNPNNMNSVAAIGGAVAGYTVVDGIQEFFVPQSSADMKDADNYKVSEGKASTYVVKEDGKKSDYTFAEFDSNTPQLAINYQASAKEAASFHDMDSAGSGPSAMVVEDIDSMRDEDDNRIYTINGYDGGAEVSVTTNQNTNLGKLPAGQAESGGVWYYAENNGRWYNFSSGTSNPALWQGTDDWSTEHSGEGPGDYLDEGDLILYTGDGKLIAKFADAEELGKYVFGDSTSYAYPLGNCPNKSGSRVGYYFNRLDDYDLGDSAWLKLNNYANNIVIDDSKLMDLIVIKKNAKGNITAKIDKDGVTIGDLIAQTDVTAGVEKYADYVYVSTANKGDIKDIVVYRFENDYVAPAAE